VSLGAEGTVAPHFQLSSLVISVTKLRESPAGCR
jgi:hypothetical protein